MKQSQGARLVKYIKFFWRIHRRGPTYMDLIATCVSTCPWRRLSPDEPGWKSALKPGERLLRGKDARGRVTFQITRRKA
jgi:hypothetical protein